MKAINIQVTDELKVMLKQLAYEHDRSEASMIRYLILQAYRKEFK